MPGLGHLSILYLDTMMWYEKSVGILKNPSSSPLLGMEQLLHGHIKSANTKGLKMKANRSRHKLYNRNFRWFHRSVKYFNIRINAKHIMYVLVFIDSLVSFGLLWDTVEPVPIRVVSRRRPTCCVHVCALAFGLGTITIFLGDSTLIHIMICLCLLLYL